MLPFLGVVCDLCGGGFQEPLPTQGAKFAKTRFLPSQVLGATTGSAGDRRHYRDVITVRDGGCVLLQVAYVFVVQVHIDERAQFTFLSIEVPAQFWMLGDQAAQGFPHGGTLYFNRGLLAGILPQRGWNMDLWHG